MQNAEFYHFDISFMFMWSCNHVIHQLLYQSSWFCFWLSSVSWQISHCNIAEQTQWSVCLVDSQSECWDQSTVWEEDDGWFIRWQTLTVQAAGMLCIDVNLVLLLVALVLHCCAPEMFLLLPTWKWELKLLSFVLSFHRENYRCIENNKTEFYLQTFTTQCHILFLFAQSALQAYFCCHCVWLYDVSWLKIVPYL